MTFLFPPSSPAPSSFVSCRHSPISGVTYVQGALPYAEGMLEEQKKQKEAAEAAAAAGGAGSPLETKKTK